MSYEDSQRDMQALLDRMDQHAQLRELRDINAKLSVPTPTPQKQIEYVYVPTYQQVEVETQESIPMEVFGAFVLLIILAKVFWK